MQRIAGALALGFVTLLAGCSSGGNKTEKALVETKTEVKVPEKFNVEFDTTKGPITIEVMREWAPRGADRFHELVRTGFYDGSRFYRVRPKFIVQFGISKEPKRNELWRQLKIADDPVKQSNKRGYLSYAMQGPGSRTTQVFINLANNTSLDTKGFAPFARIVKGMEVVDKLYGGYGEVQSLGGPGPDAIKMETQGDDYIARSYPRLDAIKTARIVE